MITAINPSIIKWARERMGYSVDDIATKMNISSSRVQEWEKGEVGISYTNLEVLAYRYFKVPITVFFSPNPPNIEAPISKFRRFPNYEIDRLSPDTLDKIRIAQVYQNSLVELLQNNKPNRQIWVDIQSNSTNLVSLSESVRKYIGISIEQQYSFNWKFRKFRTVIPVIFRTLILAS